MKCIEMSNFTGIKQINDYYCTFACVEMCLRYLNEQSFSQIDIRDKFTPYFEDDVPMFQTYEHYFMKFFPYLRAVKFNNSNVNEIIKYIKINIDNKYPVIQSRLTPKKESHSIVIICYDHEKFKYHDPGPNNAGFIRIDSFNKFLGGYRDNLVIKRIN